jgi:methionyl-tRNA formyltransferase
MVVAAYGLILPPSVLAIPPLGCLNIHASLLPRWRGAAPIHRAIEAGDRETGITIMQMDEGLDTGPMLLQQALEIEPDDTTGSLHDRLASLGASLIVDALRRLEEGTLTARPQPEEGVTYAAKIRKEEAALDFRQPAIALQNRVRAFNPFPGATARFNGVPIKIWQATGNPAGPTGQPLGTVIHADAAHGIAVACGDGTLRIAELQKPGGKRLDAEAFLKGFPMEGGSFDPF